jgi:hypothetical protein
MHERPDSRHVGLWYNDIVYYFTLLEVVLFMERNSVERVKRYEET